MTEPIRQLAAIMFTDIVGYTTLMGVDSKKALELVGINKEMLKALIEKHNGTWVKEMGDGSLSYFSSALDAVNCAVQIQESARDKLDAKLRIGVHLGDVTIQNMDVYGEGVNVASRLESLADPGGIFISDGTKKAIEGQFNFQTKDLGEFKLKNVTYPVRIFAIQGSGLPIANRKSKLQDLRESKNYGIIIILMTLFFGLTFREVLTFVLIRLNITPVWSEVFLYSIFLFLPTLSTILFIPRDKGRFLRVTRRLIPVVNVLAAVVTLVVLFWGRELGAMTTIITYEDEQGNAQEVAILKNEFVNEVGIYPFKPKNVDDNNSRSRDDSWLSKGIAYSISQNMRQYQSIETWVGFENVSLKERLGNLKLSTNYLVLGEYQWVADSLEVDIKIYNKKAKLFHKQTLTAKTLFDMSDKIKGVLINNLKLHKSVNIQTDLPFTDFITGNEQAFRHWVSGNNVAAIREDSSFAYAYLGELSDAFTYGFGDSYKRQLAEDGLDRMSKLPERDQLKFRSLYFLAIGEKEKALRTYKRFVEFNPGDPQVLRSYIYFLANNGYYENALELCRAQFSKKFDEEYGLMMLQLASLVSNPEKIEQLAQDIENIKYLIPDEDYLIVKGRLDILHGDLAGARNYFEEAQLEYPQYYTLDSLIKVIDFLQEIDDQKLQKFIELSTGTYLNERSDQAFSIKYENKRLGIFWGGQIPRRVYPIAQNSIYYCNPFYTNQQQSTLTFMKGWHGQILKVKAVRQNFSYVSERYFYKATPELLLAMDAFHLNDYEGAELLFRQTLTYDSGYYFVRNFIEAINFSTNKDALKLQNLLHGMRFINVDNDKSYLEFSYNDDMFLLNTGGPPHDIYPIKDRWIMDAYNKSYTFKVLGNTSNLSIEQYTYDNVKKIFQKTHTYHEAN